MAGRGGLGGSRQPQSAGEAENGGLQPCLAFCRVWLAEILLEPFKARGSREAAATRAAALRLARHTAWFCQTTSCSSPPASELPGILASAPVGFSLWLTVNGRACGTPVLFFFVMRRLRGLPWQPSPKLLRPEEEIYDRIGPQKLFVARFRSQATSNQDGIRAFYCLRSC